MLVQESIKLILSNSLKKTCLADQGAEGGELLFSVCIPAYEDAEAFSRCLKSVCTQTLTHIEIIVSDDSESDAIEQTVAGWNDPRIRYRRNKPALGAPANWNAALRMGQGKRVTLLHQDDWYVRPEALAEVSRLMDERAADVLISGRALYDGEGGCLGRYFLPKNAVKRFFSGFPSASLVTNRLGHPSVFFLSGRFRSIGYDESLLYFSDTDYYYNLLKSVENVIVYSDPIVGISWQRPKRLSNTYITNPQKALSELFFLHNKYAFTPFEQGISAARLCAAQVRHWYQSSATVLKTLRNGLSSKSFVIACVSIPFFLAFMVYRLAYWLATKRKWA